MNNFKDFNIEPELLSFTGDKIKIDKVLNKEIKVLDFKIEDSKVKTGTKLLTLQIEKSGENHIIFTGSTILMQQIQKVQKDKFPFNTTIVKESEHLKFT
jgi:hypothetical protein